jgi:2'-5' RNA ligase/endonuclease/exonuclease/phosphatase family metal-dependent hydrolase
MDAPAEQTFEESHDTALCLIPPPHLWGPVNSLRSLNDEKFTKWPPHVTLVYPFVKPEALADAAEALSGLDLMSDGDDISMNLEEAGVFSHRRHSTVFIRPKYGQERKHLSELRDRIYRFLGWPKGREFQPHLTVAQSEDTHAAWHQFLLEKARLVTPLAWNTHQLAILVRDPVSLNKMTASRPMRLWGYIDLASKSLIRDPVTLAAIPDLPHDSTLPFFKDTFRYDGVRALWKPLKDNLTGTDVESERPSRLVVASYNVLAEFEWPPSSSRYPKLVSNILSERASADVLVLQEVTDQFLSFLLADSSIRQLYPFSTHGSPQQLGISPLPSHLNIVVLSKFAFQWKYLPAAKKHKGFSILTFPTIQLSETSGSQPAPLVLAACHLSRGLTDTALSLKRDEITTVVEYLQSSFPQNPWLLAGDFNLASSSRTIDEGLAKGDISEKGLEYLQEIDTIVAKAGFQDSWLVTRVGPGESSSTTGSHESSLGLYEGEQGATFDPTSNDLAAASSGIGNSRPQRYDRILVRKCAQLHPHGFNMFGQLAVNENGSASQSFASDHWGIRCLLMVSPREEGNVTQSSLNFQVNLHKAALSLGSFEELKASLVSSGQFPTTAEADLRKEAIDLLQKILIEEDATTAAAETRSKVQLVLIPVGSFGLGVWTDLSDIDCLCVGNISTRVFFNLAVQKLRKASADGVKILRRVMANTGTMLELEIRGIKFDLQYCAAAAIAQG